jgi:hypothetical protein
MEPLYKVKCIYTFEKYKAFSKAVANKVRKLWLYAGLVDRGMFLMAILNFKSDFNLASIFFFAGVIFPVALMFEQNRNIKKAWESGKLNDNLEYSYEFFDDHLLRSTRASNISLGYDQLYDVFETKDMIYLMIASNQGLMMEKSNCDDGLIQLLSKYKKTK